MKLLNWLKSWTIIKHEELEILYALKQEFADLLILNENYEIELDRQDEYIDELRGEQWEKDIKEIAIFVKNITKDMA